MKKIFIVFILLVSMITLSSCGPSRSKVELTNDNIYEYLDWSFQRVFYSTAVANYYTINYSGSIEPLNENYTFEDLVIILTTSENSREYSLSSTGTENFSFSDQMVFEMFPYQSQKIVWVSIKSGSVIVN